MTAVDQPASPSWQGVDDSGRKGVDEPRQQRSTDDRGAAGLLTTLMSLVLAVVVTGVIIATGAGLVAAERARVAADASALAVLAGSPLVGGSGQPDRAAGATVARRNGATLVHVAPTDWPLGVTVRVRAPVAGPWVPRGLTLHAQASARVVSEPP